MGDTYWNGIRTTARRGTAVIAEAPKFPAYWAKHLVGERIAVVEVVPATVRNGLAMTEVPFYMDDRDGSAWRKVTEGMGMAAYGHRAFEVEPGSFEVVDRQGRIDL